ncbi:MAG TPA: hypothetical protein PKN08_05635, partial [Opitutaceae bacterium]|nr:hypothetical protein [Opitutaceae bacterium]
LGKIHWVFSRLHHFFFFAPAATPAAATEEEKVVESRKDPVNFSEPVSDLEAGFFMGAEMAFSARQGLRG